MLAQTLSGLVAGAVDGLVSDVIILDHGSVDGSRIVADAAGCRIYQQWNLPEVLTAARGTWLMVLETGARPQSGWVEEVTEYLTSSHKPARFSPSKTFRKPIRHKLFGPRIPLEAGFIIPKAAALALARDGMKLSELAANTKSMRLRSEIIPAWVLKSAIDRVPA